MSYLTSVLANAPRHYWRLADRGGSVANDLGSSKLALVETLAGAGPGVALAKPLGYSGPNKDGGSAVMGSTGLSADEGFLYTALYTVECVFWRFIQPANDVYLLGMGGAGSGFTGVGILANGNYLVANGVAAQADSGFAAVSNAWSHVALTDDGTNCRLYVNGTLRFTIGSGAFTHAWRPSVGNKPDIGSAAGVPVGALSEAAIYLATLSGATINGHYANLDNLTQPPVYNSAGLAAGAGSTTAIYNDQQTTILSAVTKDLSNAP